MKRILITGMSGTGKSSVVGALAARGYTAIDTDSDEWCEWRMVSLAGEPPEPDWVWREERMADLLAAPRETSLFVCGCKSNQGQFYDRFDHIVLLTARPEVMLGRIEARTNNPYGKSGAERALILGHLAHVEPLLRKRADVEVDTSALSVAEVADRLEALATGRPAPQEEEPEEDSPPAPR